MDVKNKEYLLQRANSSYWALRLAQAQFPTSPQLWQRILDAEKPTQGKFYENLNRYKELREMTSEEKAIVAELENNIVEYFAKRPEIFSLVQAGKIDEANDIRAKFSQPRGFASTKAMDQLLELTIKDDKARKEELLASVQRIKLIVTMLGTLTAVIAAYAAFVIIRAISAPLSQLQGTISKIAAGDTKARAMMSGKDELAQLANQFDKMMDERETVQAAIQKESVELNESILTLLQRSIPSGRRMTGRTCSSIWTS